jgi:hypothetical protein
VPISHKEKDILKDSIVQINHDVYYNIWFFLLVDLNTK